MKTVIEITTMADGSTRVSNGTSAKTKARAKANSKSKAKAKSKASPQSKTKVVKESTRKEQESEPEREPEDSGSDETDAKKKGAQQTKTKRTNRYMPTHKPVEQVAQMLWVRKIQVSILALAAGIIVGLMTRALF